MFVNLDQKCVKIRLNIKILKTNFEEDSGDKIFSSTLQNIKFPTREFYNKSINNALLIIITFTIHLNSIQYKK